MAEEPGARRARFATPGLGVLVLAVMLAVGANGCQRRTHFRPLPADSTVVRSDSLAALADRALKRWESGAGEEAARLSAGVLLADLRNHPPLEWAGRARALLDSLAIGGEVGGANQAILVNFFSRSDPEQGSWPYLFWATEKGPRMQGVEGRDLRFADLVTGQGRGVAPTAVAALFTRRGATGGQPMTFAWKPAAGGAFALAQTLGPDSLGGAGSGEFTPADSGFVLNTRTYRSPRGFTECATCPHVYTLHEFHWTPAGFVRTSDREVPSPYSSFVRFIQALQANDRTAGFQEITDSSIWDLARQNDWHQPRGLWRVAPTSDETVHEMVFFRGEQEAYRVSFDSRGGDWKISGLASTTRSVE